MLWVAEMLTFVTEIKNVVTREFINLKNSFLSFRTPPTHPHPKNQCWLHIYLLHKLYLSKTNRQTYRWSEMPTSILIVSEKGGGKKNRVHERIREEEKELGGGGGGMWEDS